MSWARAQADDAEDAAALAESVPRRRVLPHMRYSCYVTWITLG